MSHAANCPRYNHNPGAVCNCGVDELQVILASPYTVENGGTRSRVLLDVLRERVRQVKEKRYSLAHDDEHDKGELADAAAWYAISNTVHETHCCVTPFWPFMGDPPNTFTKDPGKRRRNLVKAAALLLAEIERIDRAAVK